MRAINEILLGGNLGADPKQHKTQTGKVFTTFSVAFNKEWTDGDGEVQERTTWLDVAVFLPSTADACFKYLKKGSEVLIRGELVIQHYDKDETRMEHARINIASWGHFVRFNDSKYREELENLAAAGIPLPSDAAELN